MNACRLLLPGLALGAAAIRLVSGEESAAFSKLGGALSTSQRDFRVEWGSGPHGHGDPTLQGNIGDGGANSTRPGRGSPSASAGRTTTSPRPSPLQSVTVTQ